MKSHLRAVYACYKLPIFALMCAMTAGPMATQAAPPERPNLNHTEDPRPNILPNGLYNFWVPYRLQKNRPTNFFGKLAYHFDPTSQEALTWAENHEAGHYHPHHQPAYYKSFYYPKPWEALNVNPRPDFAPPTSKIPNPRALPPTTPPSMMPPPPATVSP